MRPLATAVLAYIRKHALLKAGDRVAVAVSGGADSVALLRVLLELRSEIGIVLSVIHFNHQLRGADSDTDAQFVTDLAQQYKLDLLCESADTATYAAKRHLSIETAARELRYQFFRRSLGAARLNRIATAHTLDDQAETVLLKMTRGAGSRGLAGIYPELSITDASDSATIVRPLLASRRKDLEAYLLSLRQPWCEDASNRDLRHTRNRVRHGILPRLERYLNPAIHEALGQTAEIARAEENYWQLELLRLLPQIWTRQDTRCTLESAALIALPLALQRRVVRAACESLGLHLDFHHVEEILALASSPTAKSAELPAGWAISRNRHNLSLERKLLFVMCGYEHPLPIPGSAVVPQIKSRFDAVLVPGNRLQEYNRDHLLNRARLSSELQVRNWHSGDRFWPAHTKAPRKIKELLPVTDLTSERRLWPVVVSGNEVVWVRGFPTPAELQPQDGDDATLIQEVPLK
ncbi:MAG: tRNA lysidine(34) synthetase TilS [Terriglobales bacterium]